MRKLRKKYSTQTKKEKAQEAKQKAAAAKKAAAKKAAAEGASLGTPESRAKKLAEVRARVREKAQKVALAKPAVVADPRASHPRVLMKSVGGISAAGRDYVQDERYFAIRVQGWTR